MVTRGIFALNYDVAASDDTRQGRCEMDSHADTCVAGNNCTVLEFTGRHATVEAYSPDYPSKEVPIATVATAYDCPSSGETYVLIINEALYFGDTLSFSLLCPNQLRDNEVHVNERHRTHAPDSIFGIYIPTTPLHIPFDLDGVIAGFHSRQPTDSELDNIANHVELTSEVEWIPHSFSPSLAEEEFEDSEFLSSLRARQVRVLKSKIRKQQIQTSRECTCASQALAELEFANEVDTMNQTDPILKRIASLYTTTKISAIRTGDVSSAITPDNVAKRWMIGIEQAKKTLGVTTQKGVRTIPNPAMRRFKTQMAHLRYPRLNGTFYADIMEPKVKSIDSHKYAHVIGNGRGFTKIYPMERKNESIHSLDDFVKKIGVPETLICDNDTTMEGWSEWRKRIRKYNINPKYTEPHSPFQNKAELDIRELKRMIRRFQDRSKSPKRLWNYLAILCAKIRSFTSGPNPDLNGRCAFEQVLGWTPDISTYVMHEWFEIVGYLDENKETKLACWLGQRKTTEEAIQYSFYRNRADRL